MSSPSDVPRLADVGILELLRNDDRPTLVLGPSATNSRSRQQQEIVFTNTALDTLLEEHAQPGALKTWSQSLLGGPEENDKIWTFAGREWASTLIGDTWLVVYLSLIHI